MKKRIISVILAIFMVAMLAGCNNGTQGSTDSSVTVGSNTIESNSAGSNTTDSNSAGNNAAGNNTTDATSSATEEAGNTAEVALDTLGKKYVAVFDKSKETTADAVVSELLSQVETEISLDKVDVVEGYLAGFDNEISGFSKGVMFTPMIGSIPFVGYVFETDDTDKLLSTLKENANPAWNICVEADETVYSVRDGLVLFLMCPNNN